MSLRLGGGPVVVLAASLAAFVLVRRADPAVASWLVLLAGVALTVAWAARRPEPAGEEDGFRRFVEGIREGYFFYRHDRERRFDYLSPSIENVLGYTPDEFRGAYDAVFTDDPVNTDARSRTQRTLAGEPQSGIEVEMLAKDGSPRRFEIAEHPVRGAGGTVEFVEGIARDVTRTKRNEARLFELASRDGLSSLYNRRHFRERLEESTSLARRHGFSLCLAMIDLDGLKSVNDTYGHAAGDEMIKTAAGILRSELRNGDFVGQLETVAGRLGGDEFGAVLPFAPAEGARVAIERVLRKFGESSVTVGPDASIPLAASAGIAEYRENLRLEELERRADDALYRAKREGRGRVVIWTEAE